MLVVCVGLLCSLFLSMQMSMTAQAGNTKNYVNDLNGGIASILDPGSRNSTEVINATVKELNLTSNKLHDLLLADENGESVFCRELLMASDNELWIGAESGLYIYNLRLGKFVHLRSSINDPYLVR